TAPYIIRDWLIDGSQYLSTGAMLRIENTDKYVTIQNVFIRNVDGAQQWEAISLGRWGIDYTTKFVTIKNVNTEVGHAYGIAAYGGSQQIQIESNCVNVEANRD